MSIHHATHLTASVNHDSCCLSIGQEAVPPKSVFQVETFPHPWVLRTCLYLEHSLKIIDVQFGCLCLDSGQQSNKIGLIVVILQILMRESHRLPQLPISLTIELISSYEDSTVFFTSAEDDSISWDALIALDLNNMAYLKIL